MPNRTIYVKDTDLRLLEQAQEQLGDSVSSMFAEFLRDRVAKLTPEENRIIELMNEIVIARESLRRRSLPAFVDGEYAEAQAYAERALKSFRASEIARTKAFFWAANAYYDRAKSDAKDVGELSENIARMIEASQKRRRSRK
jgi:hypothetical protein